MSTSSSETQTTFPFQAEVHQVLDLVIHSLYSHKEIFLRELVSNAADALDKVRFRALTEPAVAAEGLDLEIRIRVDRDAKTIIIEDSGVGMTRDEMAQYLGTIAHSGTRQFMEALKKKGSSDVNLIGQFGVGFYSAFLVADRVDVVSRAAGNNEAFRWSSDAKSTFTLEPSERDARGTSVVLHLKDSELAFLEPWKLRELLTRYSDFVNHPIKLESSKKADGDAPTPSFETINQVSALWQRPRGEVTAEQHDEFYRHLTHDADGPLAHTHFSIEGTQSFTGLLYIPKHPPMFDFEPQKRGLRLFVKRVLIMENCEDLLPPWLRFVRGIIDSDDLPLNVSRELLQDSSIVRTIKKQVVKKALDLLDEMARDEGEKYQTFWKHYGAILKEGLALDADSKDRVAKLVRYASTKGDGLVSLHQYVERMPERQKAIYYVLGESEKAVATSPHLEALRGLDFEVLYMTDPVDEWASQGLGEFEGKPLVSAMKADLKLDESESEKRDRAGSEETFKHLIEKFGEVLRDGVESVRLSTRLKESPCCLVIPEGGHPAYIEQMLRDRGHAGTRSKRVLELNPAHSIIRTLSDLCAKDASSAQVTEWIEVLYDQALLTEGGKLEDPNRFARRVTHLLEQVASQTPSA